MEMKEKTVSRRGKAESLFEAGYNCAQSTVLAFEDLLPIPGAEISKIACSFGGGMGRLRETCGAVSAMFMAAGLLYGYDTPETGEKKADHYRMIQELGLEFERRNGSLVCRELLDLDVKHDSPVPSERTPNFYTHRKCGSFIGTAAEILEDYILKHPVPEERD